MHSVFFEILNSLNKQINTHRSAGRLSHPRTHYIVSKFTKYRQKTKQLSRNKVNRMIIMSGFLEF